MELNQKHKLRHKLVSSSLVVLLLCTRVIGQSKKSKLKLAVKKPCQLAPARVHPVFV